MALKGEISKTSEEVSGANRGETARRTFSVKEDAVKRGRITGSED